MPPLTAVGQYRVRQNDVLEVKVASSIATDLLASCRIVYDDGTEDILLVAQFVTGSSRLIESTFSQNQAKKNGYAVSGIVNIRRIVTKRGQTYVRLYLTQGDTQIKLCQGYCYDGHEVSMGQFVEPGPGGGEGLLEEASSFDVAGSTNTTMTLTATNALRRYYGFAILYNASADVATRTITPRLIGHIGRLGPTGFAGALAMWEGPVLTLTASEEGIYYVYNRGSGPGIVVLNDADTVVPQSTTTEPQPFPLDIGDDGTGGQSDTTLITNIGSGHANDRYAIFTFFEEWLVI